MVELLQLNSSRALINTSDYATHEVNGDVGDNSTILDLQPISWDKPDNVFRPRWLAPTIELIKYSFVLHHQHGRRVSQEWLIIQRRSKC